MTATTPGRDDEALSESMPSRPPFPFAIVGIGLVVRVLVAFGLLGGMGLVSEGDVYTKFARELLAHDWAQRGYYLPPGTSMVMAGAYQIFGAGVAV